MTDDDAELRKRYIELLDYDRRTKGGLVALLKEKCCPDSTVEVLDTKCPGKYDVVIDPGDAGTLQCVREVLKDYAPMLLEFRVVSLKDYNVLEVLQKLREMME